MNSIESLEIIDAQIHEPKPVAPLTEEQKAHAAVFEVELAREAMDSIGVDIALAVTSEAFIQVAAERYPGRFPGVVTFNWSSPDLAADAERVRRSPLNVAGRALVGNWMDATLRPEFSAGKFDPLFAAAEKLGLPLFASTHGHCAVMGAVAERHPDLTLIIDHIGVSQHPVSPPNPQPWRTFPDLLELARYPNVCVKLCGAPLLSEQAYPFDDIWPQLDRMFEAFGVDRIMWGSDYTRMRMADLPRGERPRRRGLSYADSLNYLLRTDRLRFADKKALLGGNARRILKLQEPRAQ
jgi:predicted TIM-barrel fold metal-dependent hydrolase